MRHSMSHILPWAAERSHETGATLHILGALCWLYNAQKIYILPGKSGVQFITGELAFSFSLRHGDLKCVKTEVISSGSDA